MIEKRTNKMRRIGSIAADVIRRLDMELEAKSRAVLMDRPAKSREENSREADAERTRQEPSPSPKARPVLRTIDGGKCMLAHPQASVPPLGASRHLQLVVGHVGSLTGAGN